MNNKVILEAAMEQGQGILRLAPTWVPRSFCIPGRRIKLHPDDYYALGGERGGLDERWFASTTPADNGPLTAPHEGLSFIVFEDGAATHQVLLRDAVSELQGSLIGASLWWATPFSPWLAAAMSLVITLAGFAGGLTMSAIKRDRGIKDYGSIIAGHGGMLDRIDSICFAAPIFFHLTRACFA